MAETAGGWLGFAEVVALRDSALAGDLKERQIYINVIDQHDLLQYGILWEQYAHFPWAYYTHKPSHCIKKSISGMSSPTLILKRTKLEHGKEYQFSYGKSLCS